VHSQLAERVALLTPDLAKWRITLVLLLLYCANIDMVIRVRKLSGIFELATK